MLKHIGKHNNKKIVLLYREVPEEDHMCLVVYSDLLPRMYHDSVMKVLESDSGQQSPNFSDVLFRNYMPDGRNCLEALHKDGLIKKIPTNQVLITPNMHSSVRLDELNTILNEMAKGEDAVKKLRDLEDQKGLQVKNKNRTREVGEPVSASVPIVESTGVLTDEDLAQQRLAQAEKMRADAARLLQEADTLAAEAASLTTPVKNGTKKKAATKSKKG